MGFGRLAIHGTAGLLIWAAHFVAVYALVALTCTGGVVGLGTAHGLFAVLTAAALLATAIVLYRASVAPAPTPSLRLVRYVSTVLAAFALVAIAWTGVTATLVQACEGEPAKTERAGP